MFFGIMISIVIIYTLVCIRKVYRNRKNLENMKGLISAMIISMMASVTLGVILGVIIRDLTFSTIISVSFGIVIAMAIGLPISFLTMLEGAGAGIMGGMMGAMLGDMLPTTNFILMVSFMVLIFILSVLVIFYLIDQELSSQSPQPKNSIPYSKIITTTLSLLILLFSTILESGDLDQIHLEQIERHMEGHHH
ncbi:hypothetical protein M3212_06425 [Alkalihalobacillus oceani]|uniref:hypothetical protein n=1 Tax=Halalkalibacter oceani TaxID=1653776 RepID=UPI00203AAF5C|nr:hypothetical protein [Halalkalibacter oceani]MCM3760424.1 hypothetical protein [Halalkalibacter oceani]